MRVRYTYIISPIYYVVIVRERIRVSYQYDRVGSIYIFCQIYAKPTRVGYVSLLSLLLKLYCSLQDFYVMFY